MATPIMTITSAENAVAMTLTDAAITMKLSDAVLAEVHRDIEADKDMSAPGWAGNLARFVTGSVEKLLRSSIEYPLGDIASIDYRDGTLVFTYHKQHLMTFDDVSISAHGTRKKALACFSPDDARAFFAKVCELLAR
ncbi:MAG TPA: hypothetical protein VID72_08355 [Ktedonobacterales bacterium]|jgi:hypothetical protein